MLELPEVATLAAQLNDLICGRQIETVIAGASPHKFTWYFEDPADYGRLLQGRRMEKAFAYGGRLEVEMQGACLNFMDGINMRFYEAGEKIPAKHQLYMGFTDGSSLVCTVSMYGGILCFPAGALDDFYYTAAKEKPSPLSDAFDEAYFLSLFDAKTDKLSAKALLATEQRIPGLGNGVAQDILLQAGIHPKTKVGVLDARKRRDLFRSVKETLAEMTRLGGRDTEKDIYGNPGGYQTKLSKANKAMLCPICGANVKKEQYLGGSIYYCEACQVQ